MLLLILEFNIFKLSNIFRVTCTTFNILSPGDGHGRANKPNRLYLIYSKQSLPPARPPSGFVDSSAAQLDSLSIEGSEKIGEGEWRQAAGPDGVLSRFMKGFV